MGYLDQLKQQPETYKKLLAIAAKYVTSAAKENAFPAGSKPSRKEADELLQQAGIPLEQADAILEQIVDNAYMNRKK